MGIGAALMMPSTLSIITDVFRDPAERQRAIGFWAGNEENLSGPWGTGRP
jgi:hypothetical protein